MKKLDSPLNGLTILVVDDEEELRAAIAFEFKRRGCNTLLAGSGTEALAIFKKNSVDIVLTDVRMPNGTGDALLDDIRKLDPNIPLIFLVTGYAELSEEDAAKKGANGMIHKPIDRKAFIDMMEKFAATLKRPA